MTNDKSGRNATRKLYTYNTIVENNNAKNDSS